ncbi:MAG: peptidylprolyl isomerase [Flavobacteriales bacterium]|nr:peptidylprolyl isomerase [Flavobacteriales bacterium]
MKFKWILFLSIFAIETNAQNQVLLTIDDQPVYKSEFEQIYWKNKKEKIATKEDLDEYIDLFSNFKLKVKAAEELGLDTVEKFINELAGYRQQLEKPYLIDTSINEELIKEAYHRTVNEVNASHIMVKLDANPSPDDTLKAYKKIISIKKSLLEKEQSFEETAAEISEDPSAINNKGNLGYFTAFKMLYSFEDVAYNTKIGEISNPVRTRYGYHLLKVNDIRAAKGRVKTAHIMIANSKDQTRKNVAQLKINEIHQQLLNGADFTSLAQEFSSDRNSAKKGGELGWIKSGGNYYKEFEDAVFGLENDNEISKPFKTPGGWHVVKRLAYEPIGELSSMRYELKNKIQKDSRSSKTKSSFINKLKNEYDFKLKYKEDIFIDLFSSETDTIDLSKLKKANKVLFSFSDKKFTNMDFGIYLSKTVKNKAAKSDKNSINKALKNYINFKLIEYEKSQLEVKYPDFKALVKEYRDGILLFEISDQKIWTKAIKDTTGLREYYELNSEKWTWPLRARVEIFSSSQKEILNQAFELKKENKIASDSIVKLANSTSPLNLSFEKGILQVEDHDVLSNFKTSLGISDIKTIDGKSTFIFISELIEPSPKKLNEAEGLIVSAFQEYLESKWLEEMQQKHKIEVNFDVLYSIREKP